MTAVVMKTIGLLTWGSHGDIRPFVALAEGLHAAGYNVHLLAVALDPAYQMPAPQPGLRFTLMTPLQLSPEAAAAYGAAAYEERNPLKQLATILRLCFAPAEAAIFDAALLLCAESDLLVGHYVMHPLQIAAEKLGKPYVSVQLSHVGIPSDYSHPVGGAALGRYWHRLLWWLTRIAMNRVVGPYVNRLRAQVGLRPTRDVIRSTWMSGQLNLVAVSPQLCARQPDWSQTLQVCGFLDRPNQGQEGRMPDGLDAFLDSGPAPVYMTLGSWMPSDAASQGAVLRLLSDAARQANCRAIIQCHDAAACGMASDAHRIFVNQAPHQQIFPRCAAVVHHGGAGTTQSTARAGVPSIVIAHISEQQHWGRELRRVGVALQWLDRRRLTASALASAVRCVLQTPALHTRSQQVAGAMRSEDGVAQAVRCIEQHFGPAGASNSADDSEARSPARRYALARAGEL